ncbi:MAG: hypothetical protein K1X47_17115 [Cyclobacteriaceae bacterium]|nr:hypothetical protein [Cyclobacteriaceae bacterium]
MKRLIVTAALLCIWSLAVHSQNPTPRDSVVWRIVYRDTIIYRHDTVRLRHYVFTDTVRAGAPANAVVANTTSTTRPARRKLSALNWGIGPSIGTYYSPYHGFDVNVGFGIQYYFFSIPSFRNPHMAQGRTRRK